MRRRGDAAMYYDCTAYYLSTIIIDDMVYSLHQQQTSRTSSVKTHVNSCICCVLLFVVYRFNYLSVEANETTEEVGWLGMDNNFCVR